MNPDPHPDSAEAKLQRLRWAFTRLAVAMREAKDSRYYGINCARLVLDAVDRGESIEEAIAAITIRANT